MDCDKALCLTMASRRSFLKWLGLGVLVVAASSACGAQPPSFSVNITDLGTFDPSLLQIPRGARVTWINKSSRPYSVTCDPAKVTDNAQVQLPSNAPTWDSGILYPGQTWTYT